jgi:hypothetical protein
MPMPVTARDRLETIVADYHHAHSEHRRAGVEGSVRGTLHTRLERLEAHFERLLEESVADEAAGEAWRRSLHEGWPAPAEPRPPEPVPLFKGRSPAGSVLEVRQRSDGDCDVLVDGASSVLRPLRSSPSGRSRSRSGSTTRIPGNLRGSDRSRGSAPTSPTPPGSRPGSMPPLLPPTG